MLSPRATRNPKIIWKPNQYGVPELVEIDSDPVRKANLDLFELELEFVQGLANPHYLYTLSTEGYMDNPAFINYLKYLTYWKDKEYARFIVYPQALHHLELLQHARFREELKKYEVQDFLKDSQFNHWRSWRAKGRAPIAEETPDEPQEMVTDNAAGGAP